jgi:hypothetical protein
LIAVPAVAVWAEPPAMPPFGRSEGWGVGTATFPALMFQAEAVAVVRATGAASVAIGAIGLDRRAGGGGVGRAAGDAAVRQVRGADAEVDRVGPGPRSPRSPPKSSAFPSTRSTSASAPRTCRTAASPGPGLVVAPHQAAVPGDHPGIAGAVEGRALVLRRVRSSPR